MDDMRRRISSTLALVRAALVLLEFDPEMGREVANVAPEENPEVNLREIERALSRALGRLEA